RATSTTSTMEAVPRAAGDRRDDRDLVAVLDGRVEVLEEADVFVVGEDVDEAPHLAAVVADALLDARELRLQVGDQRTDGGAAGADLFLPLCELAERRRNADGGHAGSPLGPLPLPRYRFWLVHMSSKSESRGPISF